MGGAPAEKARMSRASTVLPLLVFLWYPLSCGIVDDLSDKVFGSLQLQHLLMLAVLVASGGLFFSLPRHEGVGKTEIFMMVNLGMILLSGLVSAHMQHAVFSAVGLAGTFIFALLVARSVPFETLLKWLSFSAVFFVFVSWLYLGIDSADNWKVLHNQFTVNSFFDSKNGYGRFLLVSILIIALKWVTVGRGPLEAAAFIVAFAGLYFSDSKSSVALAFLILFFLPLFDKRRALFTAVFAGFIAVIFLALILGMLSDAVDFCGVGSDQDGLVFFGLHIPLSGRATIWSVIMHDFTNLWQWLFGFGYRVYFDTLAQTHLSEIGLGPTFIPADPHNGYIDVLLNFGLLGILYCLPSHRLAGTACALVVRITAAFSVAVGKSHGVLFR